MKRRFRFMVAICVGVGLAGLVGQTVQALEVDRAVIPRMTIGGRVIATPTVRLKTGFEGIDDDTLSEIDISDSGILLRADKQLYMNGVGGAVIGLTKPDEDSDLGDDIFFHQIHAFYNNRLGQVLIGRTRLLNTLIEFPTLRDDDLLEFTHVANASSFAENDQLQLYANQIAVDWWIDPKRFVLSVWGGARVETDVGGDREEEFDLNSAGAVFSYVLSEQLHFLEWVRQVSIGLDYQRVADAPDDDDLLAILVGAEWNLNLNPERNWSMATQFIYNHGLDDVNIDSLIGRRREKSWALVAAVRYTSRPNLLTRWQAALTAAFQNFPDEDDASQLSIVPSFVYRIGQGVDIVGQYGFTYRDDGLARATGFDTEHTFQVGLSFSFEQTFNDTVGDQRSLLNLEHGFVR